MINTRSDNATLLVRFVSSSGNRLPPDRRRRGFGLLVVGRGVPGERKVVGGELPFEGFGRCGVADLESGEALLDNVEVGEVLGGTVLFAG